MKKLFSISLFSCLISLSGFTQPKRVQVAFGGTHRQPFPRIRVDFPADTHAFFSSSIGVTGALMLLHELFPKVSLRYGLELRGFTMRGELRFDRTIQTGGASQKAGLNYEANMLNFNAPLDVVYEPLDWIYLLGGIYPTLRVDFTGGKDFGSNGFLSAEETKKYFDKLKSHLSHLGFNYRLGIGYRYKKTIGLEFTYERLLTNSLKTEFTLDQVSQPTMLKHAAVFFKLTFHLVNSRQQFLDWEGKAK